jgi:hypothetical protein
VTGVLILSKDADGKVDARAADLPGASEGAGELVKRTIASGYSAVSPEFHPVRGPHSMEAAAAAPGREQ